MAKHCIYDEWISDDGLLKIQKWVREGLSNKQIAEDKIGISEQTLYKWAKKFGEFGECLKKTKVITNSEVENALFKSATGYYVEETKTTQSDKDGLKVETTKKYIPPNTAAQIFYLKNKDPEHWQEKKEISLEDTNGVLESILALRNSAEQ